MRPGVRGLWLLATLSALAVPVFAQVAVLHRTQWPAPAGAFWPAVVVPWGARLWAVALVPAVAGLACTFGSADPRAARRVLFGGARGLLAAVVATLALIPALVWLVRLGAAPAPDVLRAYAPAALTVLTAATGSGLAGGVLPPAAAALLGLLTGAAVAWSWA